MNLSCICIYNYVYIYICVLPWCQAKAFSTLQPSRAGHVFDFWMRFPTLFRPFLFCMDLLHKESEAFFRVLQRWFCSTLPPCYKPWGPSTSVSSYKKLRKTTLKTKKREKSTPFLRDSLLSLLRKKWPGMKALPEYHNPTFVTVR